MDELRWQIQRRFQRERIALAIVGRLPRWVIYWATIRLGAAATTGKYSHQNVPEMYFMDALQRWEK